MTMTDPTHITPDHVLAACRALADTVICRRCGATGQTYGPETCTAADDEPCEGFHTIERTAFGAARTGERTQ